MNNDEKIVKEMIDTLVDTNVELWEVNLDLVSNLEIIDNIDDSDRFLKSIFIIGLVIKNL